MPKCGFPSEIYTFDNDLGAEPVQTGPAFSDLGIIIHEIKIRIRNS